jgi:hypothetical protein
MRIGSELRVTGLIGLLALCSCKKNENLSPDELQYVKTTLSLVKTKAVAKDSLGLVRLQDSVYKTSGIARAEYEKRTLSFAANAERGELVFRAIGDSLKIK